MEISLLLSSQQNSASSIGDQEGIAQHLERSGWHGPNPGRCNIDTFHNSAHYSKLSSVAFLTDSAKIGNNVHFKS
jgi:UDP-3-O-[3-hydroxymyristoyl] glucosamine N-acyltransferase